MDRKDFLKACGVVVAGATAMPLLARTAKAGTPAPKNMGLWQFYGTDDGKIYFREKPEDAWTLHSDFGSEHGIESVYRNGKEILADVSGPKGKFTLRLTPDGRYWVATGH